MRVLLASLVVLTAAACSKPASETESPAAPDVGAEDSADANAAGGDAPASAGGEMTIEEMRERSRAEIDEAACESAGGKIRQEGMLGLYRCVTPFADAGKPCKGKADCEGGCRLEGDPPTDGSEATGVCQRDDSPFGCYSEVEDGKVTGGVCVD
jgi:hypothetical protein